MKRSIIFVFVMILSISSAWADDWTPITPPNSPDARQGHSMVTLPDGRIMLFGGEGYQGELKDDLFTYDANGWNNVVPANDPPPKRKEHQAWTMGSKMFVYGGYGETGALDDMWTYDTGSNEWEEPVIGSYPPARSGHTTIPQSDGSILILGGQDSAGENLEDFWRYSSGSFQQLESCPKAYSNHIAHNAYMMGQEYLLVFGEPGIIAYYQFSNGTWGVTSGGPPLTGYACSAVVQNAQGQDVIFIFGGQTATGESDVVYEYNTGSGELTQRAELMPQPTANSAIALLDTQQAQCLKHSPLLRQTGTSTREQYNISGLLFGGLSDSIPNNNTYTFTPISPPDTITVVSPMDSVFADSVMMIWNPAEPWQATHYQLQVASDSAMTIFLADTIVTDTSYLVKELINNTDYWWQVRGYNAGGWGPYNDPVHFFVNFVVSIDDNPHQNKFYLYQNNPNPFNSSTTISFYGTTNSHELSQINIFNIKGQKIRTFYCHPELVEGSVTWDGKDENNNSIPSGVYFYKMETDNFSEIRKCVLLK
ncbi:MAG: T9SS type A sorting domain-containing protein [Candidatus Cloacimonetes bacterium]|nr:T9SS type A sorting domain-containing protein [Candidatus Cloacimonadota bacterium]